MSAADVKNTVNRGLAWVGLAASAVAVFDILSIVLILKYWVGAAEYGYATTVITLFGALELAAEMGLSAAVIQRDDHTVERLSTIFWLNLLFGGLFYGAVSAAAPLLADLHGNPEITAMFRVYGIVLLLRAAYSLHQALLKKQLRFKELSLIRVFANTAAFSVAIATAIAGEGMWCFVWGGLSRSAAFAIGTLAVNRWMPRLVFRPRQTLGYLAFGLRSSGGEILFQVYSNLDYQIINVYFGPAALGIYRAAYELVLEPVKFLSGVVTGVAFPAFARLKHDLGAVIDQYIAFTRQNLVVVLSLVAVILLAADEMLELIFRPEYAAAAGAARMLALVGILRALSYIGPPLLDGLGRPDLTLRYQVAATVVLVSLFAGCAELLGDRMGFEAVALAWAIGYPLAFVVQLTLVFSMVGLSPLGYLRRVGGVIGCIAAAAVVGAGVRLATAGLEPLARLAVVGCATLAAVAVLLAIFEDIHPRSVLRAIRPSEAPGEPAPTERGTPES